MRYLTVEEVITIHDSESTAAVREWHTLSSAVERPQASAGGEDAYPDIHTKAAALLHGLASTQGFTDGNKRAAVLATCAFYGFNGFILRADHIELLHSTIDIAVDSLTDVDKLADKLALWAHELPDPAGAENVDELDATE